MADLEKMMKQAQAMQEKMTKLQADLESVEVVGEAGAGKVKVHVNGKGEAKKIEIDPVLINKDEADVLCDLIVAAVNDARVKIELNVAEKTRSIMASVTGKDA